MTICSNEHLPILVHLSLLPVVLLSIILQVWQ